MTSNQTFKDPCCQLQKSHWKNNYIGAQNVVIQSTFLSSYITILMPNSLKKIIIEVWELSDSCQILDLINHQNNLSWPISALLKSVWILSRNRVQLFTGMKKYSINWFLDWKTSHWYEFYPLYLSVSSVLWYKCQRVSHPAAIISCKGCWDIWLCLVNASFWSLRTEGIVSTGSPETQDSQSNTQKKWELEYVC